MALPCRWAKGGLTGFGGRVRFRRRFGYPGRIDAYERVWLTFAGADDRAEVWLNDSRLGLRESKDGPFEFEVTELLRGRNELVIEVDGTAERGGLWGEVALEVRCTAFLRNVRVGLDGTELRVTGEVVGTAERPLELYVIHQRSTVAYATVEPAAGGQPFRLTACGLTVGVGSAVQVDLVNGATVWYTTQQEVATAPRQGSEA
jgi:hypothetical protein